MEHVRTLLGWAPHVELPIIHNHIVAFPGRDFGGSNAPIFQMIGPGSLQLGSWGPGPLEGLEPLEGEPVLLQPAHRIAMKGRNWALASRL